MTAITAPAAMGRLSTSQFAGIGVLVRRAVRADRWFWSIWVLVLAVCIPATASAYRTVISNDAAGREVAAGLAANPTMRAMLGPPYDLLHVGGFTMWRVGGFVAVCAGIMTALGVIRETRAEEENGHTELLRAGAIGRHAPLLAALLCGYGASALLGLITGGSMVALGAGVTGSLALGLGLALTGTVFAGLGGCMAQLTASARTARGLAMGILAATYLVRAFADGAATDSALRHLGWLSPVQWAALARPYAGERWWVLLLPLVATVLLAGGAFALEARRDHGSGLRPTRPGPAEGAPQLRSAAALAWRLDRGSVLWSMLAFAVFALAMGSLSDVFDQIADDPSLVERFRRMGAGAQMLSDAFYVAMLGILVVIIALVGLSLFERLRKEEESSRGELMLSTATSRTRQLSAYVVPALVVPVLLLLLSGVAMALPEVWRGGDASRIGQLAGAGFALAPAVVLIVALAVAVHSLAPRLHLLPWAITGWSLVINWIGAVLGMPQWMLDATPFAALPQIPAESMSWTPVILESLLAAGLLALGWWGYRRRDLT